MLLDVSKTVDQCLMCLVNVWAIFIRQEKCYINITELYNANNKSIYNQSHIQYIKKNNDE